MTITPGSQEAAPRGETGYMRVTDLAVPRLYHAEIGDLSGAIVHALDPSIKQGSIISHLRQLDAKVKSQTLDHEERDQNCEPLQWINLIQDTINNAPEELHSAIPHVNNLLDDINTIQPLPTEHAYETAIRRVNACHLRQAYLEFMLGELRQKYHQTFTPGSPDDEHSLENLSSSLATFVDNNVTQLLSTWDVVSSQLKNEAQTIHADFTSQVSGAVHDTFEVRLLYAASGTYTDLHTRWINSINNELGISVLTAPEDLWSQYERSKPSRFHIAEWMESNNIPTTEFFMRNLHFFKNKTPEFISFFKSMTQLEIQQWMLNVFNNRKKPFEMAKEIDLMEVLPIAHRSSRLKPLSDLPDEIRLQLARNGIHPHQWAQLLRMVCQALRHNEYVLPNYAQNPEYKALAQRILANAERKQAAIQSEYNTGAGTSVERAYKKSKAEGALGKEKQQLLRTAQGGLKHYTQRQQLLSLVQGEYFQLFQ
ncbi:MAG: hypothetical protein ACEQSA_01200 [Weeksellaceae bacterium]